MPSDSNGVYSLPDGYLAVTGETVLASQHNPPLEDLAASMTLRVMRTGATPFTGPAKFADGEVGAPGLTFASATSTGLYKTADGIGVAVGGAMVAEFTSGGIRTGARYLGELIPRASVIVPPLTVLPYGQTLSRTTYPAMWEFVQIEIAGGNTFYNNGNGSTTFGIGDLRGRAVAGMDNMGGVAAGRITFAGSGILPTTVGATGGTEAHTLTIPQMPVHAHANSLNDPGHDHGVTGGTIGGAAAASADTGALSGVINASAINITPNTTGITITNANSGNGLSHPNVQPTLFTYFLLFVGA